MADEQIGHVPSLNEMVFQNRNKEYGAYDLRKSYPFLLTKSFLIGASLFTASVLVPFAYMTYQRLNKDTTEVKAKTIEIIEDEPIQEEIKENDPAPPPPPPPPKEEPPKIEIIQNVVPEPARAPKIETPPPPVAVTKEAVVGVKPQEGEKTKGYVAPAVIAPPSSSAPPRAEVVKAGPSKTEVYESVDQESEFPNGGINGFRSRVGEAVDTSAVGDAEGTVRTTVTFVVELDGSISNVTATGSNSEFNREAERAVRSIRTKWKPAKVNGEPVRSRFRLPLAVNIE